MWHNPLLVVLNRGLKAGWPTAARVHERPLHGRSEEARFFVGVSGDNVEPQHDVRAGQLRGWLKMLPIDRERRRHLCRRSGEAQALLALDPAEMREALALMDTSLP